MLAPRPTPKLEDHTLSAVLDYLFDIFATILHIGGRFSTHNLRSHRVVVTGTQIVIDFVFTLWNSNAADAIKLHSDQFKNMIKYSEAAIYLKHLDSLTALVRIQSLESCEGFLLENMTFEEVLTVPYCCATGLTNLYVFTSQAFRSVFTRIRFKFQ